MGAAPGAGLACLVRHTTPAEGTIGFSYVSDPLAAGAHTINLECNDTADDTIFYDEQTLSAVYVGGS